MATRGEESFAEETHNSFGYGVHMCMIYRDESERQKMISKFLESSLNNREKVFYFTDSPEPEDVLSWLAELGVTFPEKQMSVSLTVPTYCPEGHFVPEEMIDRLCSCHNQAKAEGYVCASITGETNWLLKHIPGTERFIEYEALINNILNTHPSSVLCQYDATKFDGGTIFDILQVHPLMLVHGQIVKNPTYIRPEEFIKEFRSRR